MPDKVISATLKVNTGSAATDVGAVNKALGDTGKAASAAGSQSTSAFSTLKQGLSEIPGPLKGVADGAGTVNTALKALAANPLVLVVTLLVAALYGLYKAFASTEEGAEKIEQIFSGLGAIVTVIRDRILKLAGAVVDFFEGNFRKAISETKEAVTGVGDAMATAYNKAADATRNLQEAQDDLNRRISVNRAELEKNLAATKELITDETASYSDRKKAIEEVRVAEAKQSADELANAKKTLVALNEKLSLDKQDANLNDQIAQQKIKIDQIEQQSSTEQRALNRANHSADQQEQAEANAAAQKAHEDQQKRLQEEIALEKEFDEIRKQRIQFGSLDLVTQKDVNDDLLEQKQKQADAEKKIDDDRINHQLATMNKLKDPLLQSVKAEQAASNQKKAIWTGEQELHRSELEATGNALGVFSNLLGKNTIASKILGIAQATINTFLGATEALKQPSTLPSPFDVIAKVASVGTIIATGLSAVKSIANTNVAGASGGASIPQPESVSPAAPVAPVQQGTSIDQSSIAGIGNATSGRTYVLSQDVSHDADRNERLNRAARLGG